MQIRKLVLFAGIAVLAALGVVLTATVLFAEPKDGRLNLEAHFGGDALYCVDKNYNPTTVYPSDGQGGLRLLDIGGNEKWFIPAADILSAVAQATASNGGVTVAEGWGTYGPASLFVVVVGGVPQFTFTGWDEHGKQNSFVFSWCDPVGKRTFPNDKHGSSLCSSGTVDKIFEEEDEEGYLSCLAKAGCGDVDNEQAGECFCDHYGDQYCTKID